MTQKQLDTSPIFYTTNEVAKLLGVTARTVQMWADSGLIKVSKTPGGHRRISSEEYKRLDRQINYSDHRTVADVSVEALHKKEPFTVLVVEDDQDLLNLYQMQMSEWDFEFELLTANDGYQGLLLSGVNIPNVIITDLFMPNMDGFHMIDVMSSNRHLADCEIVVVTGLSQQDIEKRFPLPESVTVLSKPIPFETLKNIIKLKMEASVQADARVGE
jgi:excisionase family DNA binding protein